MSVYAQPHILKMRPCSNFLDRFLTIYEIPKASVVIGTSMPFNLPFFTSFELCLYKKAGQPDPDKRSRQIHR